MTSPKITEREVLGFFYERLMQNPGMAWLDAICTAPFDSDQDSESYAWLGMTPQLVEKHGQKRFQQLRDTVWEVKNVEYQNGISFPLKHILYDKTGQVQVRTAEFADRVNAHWATLVAPMILAGDSTVCYDGQYFFDTDHVEGDSGSQSNDIQADISAYAVTTHGTTTAPSGAEAVFAIMDGIKQIVGLKDDQGEYTNENMTEFLVMTGMPLSIPLLSALKNRSIDGGDDNILIEQDSYRIRLQASPRLSTWTDKFAVFATQGMQKPFIRQQRVPNQSGAGYDAAGIRTVTLWDDSEHAKKHDECLMSIETERAAAYGDWKKGCLVTLV